MTPKDYARALCGESGRHASTPDVAARLPLATHDNQGSIQLGLSSSLDEKRGSRHSGSPSQ